VLKKVAARASLACGSKLLLLLTVNDSASAKGSRQSVYIHIHKLNVHSTTRCPSEEKSIKTEKKMVPFQHHHNPHHPTRARPVVLVVVQLVLLLLLLCSSIRMVQGQEQTDCSVQLPPLQIQDKHWVRSDTGEYVPIKGLGYYPRPNAGSLIGNNIDFYTDQYAQVWQRDIENFKALNINALRIYGVDPGGNHDGFMCALAEAGIYLMLDLTANCDGCHLVDAAAPNCYPAVLKDRGHYVISTFGKYSNVMAFSAGNEINYALGTGTDFAVCQKQFATDMRRYITGCDSLRNIPVGIVLADIDQAIFAQYYGCKHDSDDDLVVNEWIGLNQYRHQNYLNTDPDNIPGYEALLAEYQALALPIPVLFTEFGGTNPSFPTIDGYAGQRDFLQVETLFSERYKAEFAGGFVFEYSLEKRHVKVDFPFTEYDRNNFGVGYFGSAECDAVKTECEYIRFPQFDSLAAKYAAVSMEAPLDLGRGFGPVATCPQEFDEIGSFDWPSEGAGLNCPVYGCPPGGCVPTPTTEAPSPTATEQPAVVAPSPTASPVTVAPSTDQPGSITTLPPTTKTTSSPVTTDASAAVSSRQAALHTAACLAIVLLSLRL